ncbi:ribosome small subunit-dependent GTPase A [Bryobacter aggregatus]|uniref:ribosome small subunit-dependent GTPase A n=1 Tax=Bryobacter aggregatus TaxID=360054 RepID=UPI0004E0DB37|nr:ribosome small subunit-dependent GTPase A [Bryobacter aggregatus]
MNLESIGWQDHFARQMDASDRFTPGRVAQSQRDRYLVWTEAGAVQATISGTLRQQSDPLWPITGDWVLLSEGNSILRVLERKSLIARKDPGGGLRPQILATNIDVLFIVAGLDHDFNLRRLERYVVLAREGGVRPVILLNKADLSSEVESLAAQTRAVVGEIPVFAMSATEARGLDVLGQQMGTNETAAMVGSSGAGKSTILNRLLGEERQPTQSVRESDSRGFHTTTSRELFQLPQGWLLMDLPGIRELQLLSGETVVVATFEDILAAAVDCRFRDCRHEGEPGCAVVDRIDPTRLQAFHKLRHESEDQERELMLQAALIEKKRSKVLQKALRDAQR